jgi:hypothetical protein
MKRIEAGIIWAELKFIFKTKNPELLRDFICSASSPLSRLRLYEATAYITSGTEKLRL